MMNWQKLLSPERLGTRHSSVGAFGRSDFHKDYDRIIFFVGFPASATQDAGSSAA